MQAKMDQFILPIVVKNLKNKIAFRKGLSINMMNIVEF